MISETMTSGPSVKKGLWSRMPVLVKALLAGLTVAGVAVRLWAFLVGMNFRHPGGWLGVPWSVLAMAAFLPFYFLYLNGHGWPRSTAAARRRDFRARNLPARVWGWSLLAGSLGMASVAGLLLVWRRLMAMPSDPMPDISHIPRLAIILVALMASFVAGFAEEAGFRGFLQAPLERRYGPWAAILLTGTVFGLLHANHAYWIPAVMPIFLLASGVLGALARLTGSILPGVIVHAVLDAVFFLWLEPLNGPVPPLVWSAGPDSAFWTSLGIFLLGGAASLWAFFRLAAVRSEPPSGMIAPI